MKKLFFILFILPVWCFAQTNITPQFKRNIPADSLLGYSIPGITGNHWLPDTSWVKKHAGGITSFKTRTGAVVPLAGDYSNITETLTNKTISGSANILSNIGNSSLTNSTISGVALGNSLFAHTPGAGIIGSNYDGHNPQTWTIDSSLMATKYYASVVVGADGIVTGMSPTTISGTTATTPSGTYRLNNLLITKGSSTNTTIDAQDASQNRYDLIVGDASGVLSLVSGVLNTDAVQPDVPANKALIASIYIPSIASGGTVTNSGGGGKGTTSNALNGGYGIIPFTFNGSTSGIKVVTDTAKVQTVSNFFPKGDTRYQKTITLTTTGSNGPATLVGQTLNIPQYSGATGANPTATAGASFVNGSATTFMRSDAAPKVDSAVFQTVANFFPKGDTRYYKSSNPSNYITLTALSATSPIFYNSSTGVISSQAASASQNGYLTSTDWSTFNNKYSLPSLTNQSVLFSNGITIAQDNNNFNYNSTTHILNVATNGDLTGTNPINIYGQYDAYEPQSSIGSVTDALTYPGVTASSSRGTGASPVINNTGDNLGGFSGWGYTGSSPAYNYFGGMSISAVGTTANNLGGQLDFYVKANNGSPSSAFQIYNNSTSRFIGNLGIGQLSPISGTPGVSTLGTGGAIPAGTYYYKITAVDYNGNQTTGSAEVSAVLTGSTSKVTLTWTAVTGATSYNIYRGTTSGGENIYYTSTTNNYVDVNGTSTGGTVPTVNTSAMVYINSNGVVTASYLGLLGLGGGNVATNIAGGTEALLSNTTGANNSGFGYHAGRNITSPSSGFNTFVGSSAGESATGGVAISNAVLVGYVAGRSGGGSGPTLVGSNAGVNSTGNYVTGIGFSALASLTTGHDIVSVGVNAGAYYGVSFGSATTINHGVYIGNNTFAAANGVTNEMVLGDNGLGNGSNTTTIGNSSTTDTYIYGNTRIPLGSQLKVAEGTNGFCGQTTLVSGTKAITITGVTTNSRCFIQAVSQGGTVSTTFEYAAVCTSNTLTITALTNGNVTNTLDTSTLNYFIVN